MFCCFNNMLTTNQGYTWADLISSLWFENLTLLEVVQITKKS